MFVFVIPVKSQKVSGNWEAFSRLFERCLKSVCNQTSHEFRVVVSCHEIPEISFNDERIFYHRVNFSPPLLTNKDSETQRRLKEEDKAKKILEGIEESEKYNPGHIMVVDSDDCINKRIVDFVNNDQNSIPGWFVNKGYYYQEGKPYAFLNTINFNQFCGSCIIIKHQYVDQLILREPFLYYDHHTMKLNDDTNLTPLPFPGALYSMANGENHYMSFNKASEIGSRGNIISLDFVQSLISKLKKYRIQFFTKKFTNSFNFYKI